jgi:hypothetical protein
VIVIPALPHPDLAIRPCRVQDIVLRFRWMYRFSWSRPVMARILARGAHWMMPDDHDIANNADGHMNIPGSYLALSCHDVPHWAGPHHA